METYEELYAFAKANGLKKTKKLLRDYVTSGEPDEFMPGYSTRALCRCASHGLEGGDINEVPATYLHTEYGPDLYDHMWSGDK